MKLISQICPHCGGKINIDLNRKQAYCQYCGNSLLLEDENTININKRFIDEARLKEAEVRLKELEYTHERFLSRVMKAKVCRTLILIYIAAIAIGWLVAGDEGVVSVLVYGGILMLFLKPKHVQEDEDKRRFWGQRL